MASVKHNQNTCKSEKGGQIEATIWINDSKRTSDLIDLVLILLRTFLKPLEWIDNVELLRKSPSKGWWFWLNTSFITWQGFKRFLISLKSYSLRFHNKISANEQIKTNASSDGILKRDDDPSTLPFKCSNPHKKRLNMDVFNG